jgi:hypothetical protein
MRQKMGVCDLKDSQLRRKSNHNSNQNQSQFFPPKIAENSDHNIDPMFIEKAFFVASTFPN